MADDEPVIASAVVVPESSAPASPRDNPQKRRQSSVSEAGSKRPRLSIDDTNNDSQDGPRHQNDSPTDRRADRRRSGAVEERKRGQRLFGALLGTLSQSSSTAAQRRRADIDKKQQEKLKLQAQEFDQRKKQRLEELMVVRRREQKKFDEQTMRIRHSNILAQAHFLQTKTEPKLFYKPWELRPEEEDIIKAQVEEAEASIERELAEFERRKQAEEEATPEKEADAEAHKTEDMVGSEQANEPPKSPQEQDNAATSDDQVDPVSHPDSQENGHAAKDHDNKAKEHHDDHGEEVLEAEEDTVIY
ncbi:Pinin/SDK/MemA protein [Lasiodiplodia theobromae]|uniref:Transcriptional regulator ICP22-like protein n=1 Tax=Lasiodiplodia theobromae TaxID=45133 RepID=A0A5N5DQF1_9PEZI|nr:Pinin/SDK/MemA protein [Lasiodiplodia theobromae]KAB2578964.1 Transcriptional regulator ICP22-like protein [Lasiodiplodia theobromae]KAF4544698.1 Pinin/SDK/MemA protein [Lasiodiplodia theobromae]KAF9637929.1 Pinin/SDK/MemA protein [Lasiodiplodia theobromae]